VEWWVQEALHTLLPPKDASLFLVGDGSEKPKRGTQHPLAQKGRKSEHHPGFFGMRFALLGQKKLLGKIVGVMFPTLFGCRTLSELCRVRGWDKNWPSRVLGALPKRSWLKRLRRLGLEVLVLLWHHVSTQSRATQSRWQWVHDQMAGE